MCKHIFWHFFEKFRFWLGGAAPQRPPVFLGGGKAPPDPLLKRSCLAFDRGGQTGPPRSNAFFFGAVDDTGAADDRPPAVRQPSTGAADDPQTLTTTANPEMH